MITKQEFTTIKDEVENAINQAFDYAKNNELENNDYVLFLSNAENLTDYEEYGRNPHIIDYRVNKIKDQERIKFLLHYLNSNYQFQNDSSIDTQISIALELMIYTHIWESKPFLRQLKKLTNLCQPLEYDWAVKVPEMGKHDFIRNDIRAILKKINLDLHTVISNGFHTSLRNAFAHSDYFFQFESPIIYLTNYGGASWELESITFDDWTRKFCYSVLLSYTFQNKFENEKQALGNAKYNVNLRDRNGSKVDGIIVYDSDCNSFSGRIK